MNAMTCIKLNHLILAGRVLFLTGISDRARLHHRNGNKGTKEMAKAIGVTVFFLCVIVAQIAASGGTDRATHFVMHGLGF